MIIYLIRHGITDACNNDQIINKNVSLNQLGIIQIEYIRSKIDKNVKNIICSNTKRTIETSKIIQQKIISNINIDDRLLNKNKEKNDELYYQVIKCLLNELIIKDENIILVTHGKIVKMIFSIIKFNKIDKSYTDSLDLGYGSLCILEYYNNKFDIKLYNYHLN